jgi:uncharacterized membrane-anchored protein YjiN (DUF445 family)
MKIDKAVFVTFLMPILVCLGVVWLKSGGGSLARIFTAAAIAGTIGTLVDWMAVVMVFKRKWWIPFSGVIPRNKEAISDEIAEMVGKQWFTPTALAAHLEEVDLKPSLCGALREVLLSDEVQRGLRVHFTRTAVERLNGPETEAYAADQAGRALRRGVGRLPGPLALLGKGAVELGLLDVLDLPGKTGRAVLEATRAALKKAADEGELEKLFKDETAKLIPALVTPATERMVKRALVETFTKTVDVGEVVRCRLARLSPDDIRIMIEAKAKTHLDWIRVNGALGGFVLGAAVEVVRLGFGLV